MNKKTMVDLQTYKKSLPKYELVSNVLNVLAKELESGKRLFELQIINGSWVVKNSNGGFMNKNNGLFYLTSDLSSFGFEFKKSAINKFNEFYGDTNSK